MDKNKNQTIVVKIICVLLSFGLWLYITNVENPVRTYDIKNIPVELINIDSITDSNFALVEGQNFTVDLKLEGSSSEVTKVKPENFKIVADMANYALKAGQNTIPVQIISYPENITIKNNGFLGIKVNLENIETKELVIKSNIKINYKEGIYELEQKINPTTVKVIGGRSSIDNITSAVITGEEKDVDKNIENLYDIHFIDSDGNEITDVDSNIKKAKLSITITNGKSIPINLKTTGQTESGYELNGYELSSTNIGIVGDSNTIDKIQSIDTQLVDISSFKQDTEVEVKLNIPEGVSIQNQTDTIKVKFKIKKQEITTKNISCTVQYNNLNENLALESSIKDVNIVLSGTQSELDNINEKNISVTLDLSTINQEGTYTYKPEAVLTGGNNVTINSIDNVTIIVKKKE